MTVRALILQGQKALLIHRLSEGREYYVLPGGHVEQGETDEQALVREIKEETGLDARIQCRLWTLFNRFDKSEHHIYLVTRFTGEIQLGGEEAIKNSGQDRYILEWHSLADISSLNIVPEQLRALIPQLAHDYHDFVKPFSRKPRVSR